MSHTNIMESGTSAALPLRDAWGRPRNDRLVEPAPHRRELPDPDHTPPPPPPGRRAWTLPVTA